MTHTKPLHLIPKHTRTNSYAYTTHSQFFPLFAHSEYETLEELELLHELNPIETIRNHLSHHDYDHEYIEDVKTWIK